MLPNATLFVLLLVVTFFDRNVFVLGTNKVVFRGKLFRSNSATRHLVVRHERERGGTNRGTCAAW